MFKTSWDVVSWEVGRRLTWDISTSHLRRQYSVTISLFDHFELNKFFKIFSLKLSLNFNLKKKYKYEFLFACFVYIDYIFKHHVLTKCINPVYVILPHLSSSIFRKTMYKGYV